MYAMYNYREVSETSPDTITKSENGIKHPENYSKFGSKKIVTSLVEDAVSH